MIYEGACKPLDNWVYCIGIAAERYLGLSKGLLKQWRLKGKYSNLLPFHRNLACNRVIYKRIDLDAFLSLRIYKPRHHRCKEKVKV